MKLTKEDFAAALDQAVEIGEPLLVAGHELEKNGIDPGVIGIAYAKAGLEFLRKGRTPQEVAGILEGFATTELSRGQGLN